MFFVRLGSKELRLSPANLGTTCFGIWNSRLEHQKMRHQCDSVDEVDKVKKRIKEFARNTSEELVPELLQPLLHTRPATTDSIFEQLFFVIRGTRMHLLLPGNAIRRMITLINHAESRCHTEETTETGLRSLFRYHLLR